MMIEPDLNRNAFTFRISEEMALDMSYFPKKGHLETTPLTDEDRAEHARAVAAYEEVMSNPWIELGGYDYDFDVQPLKPHTVFVAEETDEEHLARWVAAGRPVRNPIREAMGRISRAFDKAIFEGARDV